MTARRAPECDVGGSGMLIGYARVSKADGSQATSLQRDALVGAGVEEDRIYEDSVSGAREERPGLTECLRVLRPGDTLVVWKLDRLGRSLKQLVCTVERLNEAGVNLRILTGPATGDTSDPSTRFMFHVFAALAEIERDLIRERTYAGLASARARGRKGGRPPVPMANILHAAQLMKNPAASARAVAREAGISSSTLYRYVTPNGELRRAAKEMLDRLTTKGRHRRGNGGH